jgi:hypothetical protein
MKRKFEEHAVNLVYKKEWNMLWPHMYLVNYQEMAPVMDQNPFGDK